VTKVKHTHACVRDSSGRVTRLLWYYTQPD